MSSFLHRFLVFALVTIVVGAAVETQARPVGVAGGVRAGHHHHHHGHWRFGIGLGVGFGPYYPYAPYGWAPGYVVVEPGPVAYERRVIPEAVPSASSAPDPVFAPRNGQDATRTEADRQACNRWAMTQPAAMAEAAAFHRATLSCMEQRGYSVR